MVGAKIVKAYKAEFRPLYVASQLYKFVYGIKKGGIQFLTNKQKRKLIERMSNMQMNNPQRTVLSVTEPFNLGQTPSN